MDSVRFRIRLLAVISALALGTALLELASWGLYRAAEGRRFSYERLRSQRAEVVAEWTRMTGWTEAPPRKPLPVDPDGIEGRPDKTPAETVPHPFFGYTADPEGAAVAGALGRGGMVVSEHGFLVLPKPSGTGPVWTVAVFGGSVAAYLSVDGRQALVETLERSPLARGRRVRVRTFAAPGYKQPQMATALVYLLSLGERFDAVVEIDGVNDVGLSYLEHRLRGKFPFYPRDWHYLIANQGDPKEQLRIGTIAYLHSRRAALAAAFSRRPFRWSVTAALVWRRIDRSLASRLAAAREESLRHATAAQTYREGGPVRVYADDDALMKDIARVWARSSLQMHALCAGAGMRYYHFLQPNQYVANSKPMGEGEKAVAYSEAQPFRVPIEKGYSFLQAEGRELVAAGVAFTDLTAVFAGTTEPLYVDDCCHVSPRGSELMARALGARMAADR